MFVVEYSSSFVPLRDAIYFRTNQLRITFHSDSIFSLALNPNFLNLTINREKFWL